MKRKRVSIFIFLLIFILGCGNYSSNRSSKYFDDFDLYLKGRIIYTEHHNSSNYINCLSVDTSNYKNFDQRDSLEVYFILKKRKCAIFYGNADIKGVHKFREGDVVEIFGKERILTCISESGKFKFARAPLVITSKSFFPQYRINELIEKCENGEFENR